MRAEGEDGRFGGQSLSTLNADPMETSGKPHDPHDGLQHHVHQPTEEPAHRSAYNTTSVWTQHTALQQHTSTALSGEKSPVFTSVLLHFPVAQIVEHGASNAKIMGSIPRESKSWSNVKL